MIFIRGLNKRYLQGGLDKKNIYKGVWINDIYKVV